MKKIIKHKWKKYINGYTIGNQCEKCGCLRYWDFDYNQQMYRWGTHLTYRAPSCIIMNGKPYNKIDG
jgi:hypothetical protein